MKDTRATVLGPGREFDLIRRLVERWGPLTRGTGDDAAILDVPPGMRLIASTDAATEGVHFRRDWLTMEETGYRSATGALSDLAAMAATPLGMLVAIAVGADATSSLDDLADGIGAAAKAAHCPIVGGDLIRADRLCLTITVLGAAARPMRRSGAREGNVLYVTGRLGGPGAALAALAAGTPPQPGHRARLARPSARIDEARWLAERGATALIDISDGLASEARHLAAASEVMLSVDLDRLPCAPGVEPAAAAASGEEYELLVALPDELDVTAFEARFGIPLTRIGQVEAAGGGTVTFRAGGERIDLSGGYNHFSP